MSNSINSPSWLQRPIKGVLLDIYGVIINSADDGVQIIKGSINAVKKLKEASIPVRFCTNESQLSQKQIFERLSSIGLPVKLGEVFSPVPAALRHLKSNQLRPYLIVHDDVIECFSHIEQTEPNCVVIGDAANNFSYQALNEAFNILLKHPKLVAMGYGFFYEENLAEKYTLQLANILLEETGNYTCIMGSNEKFKIRRSFSVTVTEKPSQHVRIEQLLPRKPILVKEEKFMFTCVSSTEDSIKVFRWDLLSPSLKSANRWKAPDDGKHYTIKTLKEERCSAKNSTWMFDKVTELLHGSLISCVTFDRHGYDRKVSRLRVIDQPNDPSEDLHANASGASAIVIAVVVIIVVALVVGVAIFLFKQAKKKEGRKRKRSYFYEKSPTDGSIS